MSELTAAPVLFVVVLSVVFLLLPSLYLYMMLRERRVFERYLNR